MNNTRREKKLSHKVLISGLAVIFSLVMVLTMISAPTVQVSSQVVSPEISSQGYIPNPVMNSNITWSNFNSSWGTFEYSNGTADNNLSTGFNPLYANPISINPADIQTTALKRTLGTSSTYWNSTYYNYGGNSAIITGAKGKLYYTTKSSDTAVVFGRLYWNISTNYIPSLNLQFDYVTILYVTNQTGTGNAQLTFGISNGSTSAGTSGSFTGIKNETTYTSGNAITSTTGTTFLSVPASDFVQNINSGYMQIGLTQTIPETTTNGSLIENTTILGLSITSYPITLGTYTNTTGNHPITAMLTSNGQNTATQFDPNFAWSSITNNGYSVSTSQSLQNPTSQQTSINNNNYIEQATYQGFFQLPNAPDLTYTNTNITLQMSMSGSQYEVANLNGISYLSSIQAKSNGTFSFGTVTPTTQNTIILEVQFTAAQWNASSTAPSFWSIQGLEYYWWIGVIGLLSFIGLGSLASSHWGGTEENLKVPKGKFGR